MIGVLDWGIGGLGFVRALRGAQPDARVIYFSDAGFTPYGKVPAAQLTARVREVLGRMQACGATEVVIACNAASTVLPRLGVDGIAGQLQLAGVAEPLPVSGVIAHGVGMLLPPGTGRRGAGRIGVIGGARTIRSHAYGRPLRARGLHVQERIAQPLSARIERGELHTPALRQELHTILAPLHGIDTLLLACTHYAAITTSISELLPGVRILDPIDALVPWVLRNWQPRGAVTTRKHAVDRVLTTGDARAMRRAAKLAFGVELAKIEQLTR